MKKFVIILGSLKRTMKKIVARKDVQIICIYREIYCSVMKDTRLISSYEMSPRSQLNFALSSILRISKNLK